MQKYKYITLLFVVLFLVGCSKDDVVSIGNLRGEKSVYGFGVGGATTRTFINDDGVTISWSNDDKVALWAMPATGGDYVLSNQTFNTWFVTADNSQAYFTAELASQMPDSGDENKNDDYTYYVCYPLPQSVSGTTATFNLPSTQDGKMGGGADIMVGEGEGPALAKLYNSEATPAPDYVMDDGVKLHMKHLIHALRFYVPAGKWGFDNGETIERIVFTMPDNVAGTVTTDVSAESPALSSIANATNTISLNLKEPIGASTANAEGVINYDYACASILPGTYNGDMTVKIYSQTKAAQVTIPINGREMEAGHITPVGLNCTNVVNRPKISFRIASNNLGEQPYKITLTSSDTSTQWKAGDDHVYEYYTGSESSTIAVGGGFDIYYDEETLSSISGKRVTVIYESKSAIVTETIDMPSMSNGTSYEISLNVPWLMYQNFSSLQKYEDEATTGSKTLDSVGLPGWTASRSNGSAGGCVSLRPFYAWLAGRYQGRLDSEFFGDRLKKTVSVEVKINAGAEKVKTPLQVGKTTTSGAIEASTEIESVATTIDIPKSTNSSMPEHTYTVDGVTADHRLSWRTNITSGSWGTYSDTPIDNIRVKIK